MGLSRGLGFLQAQELDLEFSFGGRGVRGLELSGVLFRALR